MSLKVYNTLSNRIEEFHEIVPGQVGLYTCGPTVYDFAHIGNFRAYVFEDLFKRHLLFRGYRVKHVMNLTDIDDKTIRKSGSLGVPLQQVTDPFIAAFFEDIATLNILRADVYPRATEHIPEMVDIITKLMEKGHAYHKDGSIYFNIESFPAYGRLANIERGNLKVGVRVDVDEYEKESVQDFVLWKGWKENEPCWETTIGKGRPGWHIECSAMSEKYLGPHFDVHMGGVDNIFPHHENEIAQSECANGRQFVNYWLHCQHLIVENQKMSKSLGNFFTLRDLVAKGHDPLAIRYLLLATHYRKPLNFTFDGLEGAAQALRRIRDFLFTLENLPAPAEQGNGEVAALIHSARDEFTACLDDDLNISGALGAFFEFMHRVNQLRDTLSRADADAVRGFVRELDRVLGVLPEEKTVSLDEEIAAKIAERQKARQEKNFKLADAIRDELKARGIVLIDTPAGVKWKIEQ